MYSTRSHLTSLSRNLKIQCPIFCTTHTPRYFHVSSWLGDRQETARTRLRKISYAFDPVQTQSKEPSTNRFSFLNSKAVTKLPELQHANCIVPPTLKVPWPTTFPASLQSKYWEEAEEAARDLIRTIFTKRPRDVSAKYIEAVIDAAVSFTVNVAPLGSLTRTKCLARAYVLIFMHDDAVESGNFDATIPRDYDARNKHTHTGFETVTQEILREDAVQGSRFLESMISWGSLPQTVQQNTTFPTLMDYITHRVEDVGAYPVFRSVEFASDIYVTEQDERVIDRLRFLCAKHFALVNDLYSYPKEVVAEQEHGEPLLNAVKVVQDLTGVSPSSAGSILRGIILDIEQEIGEEYGRLVKGENTTHTQLACARGLIIAVAGNMFFLATSYRYARVIEGSKLV